MSKLPVAPESSTVGLSTKQFLQNFSGKQIFFTALENKSDISALVKEGKKKPPPIHFPESFSVCKPKLVDLHRNLIQ